MASVLINTEAARNRTESLAVSRLAPLPANGPLFRFGLRQLLFFVAVICALLGAVASTNALTALVLWLAAAIVAMHVFATALGSRLRSQTDEERFHKPAESINESSVSASERSAKIAAIRSAPRSPWHGRGSTYLPWLPRIIVGAMVFGGLAGALLLDVLIGRHTSLPGIIVGAASFSILCGWCSFLCGNFYGVFRHGFREALAEQHKDQGG